MQEDNEPGDLFVRVSDHPERQWHEFHLVICSTSHKVVKDPRAQSLIFTSYPWDGGFAMRVRSHLGRHNNSTQLL